MTTPHLTYEVAASRDGDRLFDAEQRRLVAAAPSGRDTRGGRSRAWLANALIAAGLRSRGLPPGTLEAVGSGGVTR